MTASAKEMGAYEIERELGRGAMGIVYLGVHRSLRRACAVKTISLTVTDARAIEEFVREGQAVARLGKHPYIAQVFDAGVAGGTPFIAMELVEGESLAARLQRAGPIPEAEVVEIGRKVAMALDHAHRRGIVHRDVKPANIITNADGDPQLVDFGIACDLRSREASHEVVGTPQYMAPEQVDSSVGAIDARTDVYCLGATLFTLLTARRVLDAPTVTQLFVKVVADERPSPADFVSVGEEVEAVVRKALERRPADRYQTALELADDLSRLGSGLAPRARPDGLGGRLARRVRAHPELAAVTILLALVAALAGAWFAYQTREVTSLWEALARRTARATADETRALLEPAVPTLRECAVLAEAGLLPLDDQEALSQHLLARFRFRRLDWLSFGDDAGRFTGAWRDEAGRLLVNRSWIDARGAGHLREVVAGGGAVVRSSDDWRYDPRTRPWYALAAGAREPAWTAPYGWYGAKELGITATLAVRQGERVRGAFTADFALTAISRFLRGASLGRRGRAYLLDTGGAVLASSGDDPSKPDPLLASAIASVEGGLGTLRRGETAARRFVHEGEAHVVALELHEAAPGLTAVTAVIVPEDEVTGDLRASASRALRRGGLIAIALLAGAAALAWARRARLLRAMRRRRAAGTPPAAEAGPGSGPGAGPSAGAPPAPPALDEGTIEQPAPPPGAPGP